MYTDVPFSITQAWFVYFFVYYLTIYNFGKKYYLHSHHFLFIYKLAISNKTKIISSNNTSVLIFICFTPIFVHFWMFASMTLAYPSLLLTVFHPFHLPRALLCTHQRYSVLICKVLLHVVASLNIQVCLRCPFSRDPLHGHRLSSIAKKSSKVFIKWQIKFLHPCSRFLSCIVGFHVIFLLQEGTLLP